MSDEADELVEMIRNSELRIASISPTKSSMILAVGESTHVAANSISDTGHTQTLIDSVSWSSHEPAVATITSTGDIKAIAVGTTEIQLNWREHASSAVVTVTEASLQNLAITPISLELDECQSTPVTAIGTYTDGSQRALPLSANWSLQNTSLGRIDVIDDGATTLVSRMAGNTTLSVTVDAVTASIPVVFLDTLSAIDVDPQLTSLLPGDSINMSVSGLYSDGMVANLNGVADWHRLDQSPVDEFLIMEDTVFNQLAITALEPGTANFEVQCGGISQLVNIVIELPPVLESITINDDSAVELTDEAPLSLLVLANYSNGETENVSMSATYALLEGDVDHFSLGDTLESFGQITVNPDIIIERAVMVQISYKDFTSIVTVYAKRGVEDTLQSIRIKTLDTLGNQSELNPDNPRYILAGETLSLFLDATYLTGDIRIPPEEIIWSNANPATATIDGLGNLQANSIGDTTISAIYSGRIVTIPISVK